jgi:hypothetical protein
MKNRLAATFLLLLMAGAGAAADRPRNWCPGADYDPAYALAREVLLPPVITDLADGQRWREAHRALAREFEAYLLDHSLATRELDGTLSVQTVDPAAASLRQFHRAVLTYLAEIASGPATYGDWSATYSERTGSLGYELPAPYPRGGGPREPLFVDCAGFDTSDAKRAIGYFADTLFSAGYLGSGTAARAARSEIQTLAGGYRNLVFNGLPMWPQEWWFNGLGIDLESEKPQPAPMWQKIFMRPSLSPAFKFDGMDDSELDAALILEPIGFIQYQTPERDRWMGGSLILTLTNGNGIGVGGLFRYNRAIFGAAYHEDDSHVLLYATVDLYDFLFSPQAANRRADAFLDGLEEAVLRDVAPAR